MNKVSKALLEGKLFQRIWRKISIFFKTAFKHIIRFISLLPTRVAHLIDYHISILFRKAYAKKVPINDKQIMFIPFQGDYTCNPKYIAEELIRRGIDCELIFSARRARLALSHEYPEGTGLVEQYSAAYYQAIMSSKVIVANSVEFLKEPCPKRDNQFLIETWHGSLGIKRFDKKAYKSSWSWKKAAELCGKRADYIISNSAFEDDVYRNSYWPKTPIMRFGHPRNDILINPSPELVDSLRRRVEDYYDISLDGKKIAMYAPTFRDSKSLSPYLVDVDRLLAALKTRFGGEWILMSRLHPTVRKLAGKYFKDKPGVFNATDYPDIQELIVITDIAITDYSSWIYDFVLSRKPGFIYATDIAEYNNERGFCYPLQSTPFPIATNMSDLLTNILHFDEDTYRAEAENFLKDRGCIEDGHASERVADLIEELLGK